MWIVRCWEWIVPHWNWEMKKRVNPNRSGETSKTPGGGSAGAGQSQTCPELSPRQISSQYTPQRQLGSTLQRQIQGAQEKRRRHLGVAALEQVKVKPDQNSPLDR